jgi:hypothetical protein
MTDRSESVVQVEVSASRKIQLSQYEPIEAFVKEVHSVPEDVEYEPWLVERQDDVMEAAERAAMRKHEEHLREEDFSDE